MVSEKRRAYNQEYYERNKARIIAQVMERLKKNHYAYQKTPEARERINIKRKTRLLYPLKNAFCFNCGNQATEHHHFTTPITIHEFVYICHDCHVGIHRDKGVRTWEHLDKPQLLLKASCGN